MLADPRIYEDVMRKRGTPVAILPRDPTPEAVNAIFGVGGVTTGHATRIYFELYAHLTRPKPSPTRTKWEVTGYNSGSLHKVTHTIVVTEEERNRAVWLAEKAGCDVVTSTKREVAT